MPNNLINSILCDVASLLGLRHCALCGGELSPSQVALCARCELEAPLTGLWREQDNILRRELQPLFPLYHASALVWLHQSGPWREAIHHFKYHNELLCAKHLGEYYGTVLCREGVFHRAVDCVVAVPLHWRRRLSRGYNQSEILAQGIAKSLGARCEFDAVRRHIYNPSQTSKPSFERRANVEGIFSVRRPEALRGRHILLVDDLYTTGATISSLANAILEAQPEVELSVCFMAAPYHLELLKD